MFVVIKIIYELYYILFMFSDIQPQPIDCAYPVIKETIPRSSLGYATNNKYPEFPPLMSDGRSVTATWQPESTINDDLIQSNNIRSNWQYRKYLTQNAKDIMSYNFRESSNDVGYYKRPIDLPNMQSNNVSNMNGTPYLFKSVLDNSKPFGYQSTNLKELYLSREQLDSRKISPVITQDDLVRNIYNK
uniref:Uncharacterized protein n=1 Tax=viral metagenome TaxID=1070528 RepID=A0A6C0JKG7_9ZZZZ